MKRRNIILVIILFSIIIPLNISNIQAAEGDVVWTRTYNGTDNDIDMGNGIAVDKSGNVYVIGYLDDAAQLQDVWIIKYDPAGNSIWTNTYHGWRDYGRGIAVDTNCNVYAIGQTWQAGQEYDIWVRKYNSDGSVDWTRTHNGNANGYDIGKGIAVDTSGNVYAIGDERVTGEGANIWVRKYDLLFKTIWSPFFKAI